MSRDFSKVKRVVLKLGTGVLTSGIGKLDEARIAAIGREVSALLKRGVEVIVVSSGAVGLGMGKLGLKKRPRALSSVQKCAAVGQSILMDTWQKAMSPHHITVAQLLLTREDVQARHRHLAIKQLLDEILAEGILPVINENDSVCAQEIKFGDNDVLSALTAILTRSDLLVILSTAPGLVDLKGSRKVLPTVEKITPQIEAMAGGTSSVTAVGGMITKIHAAQIAVQSGCAVVIAGGQKDGALTQIFEGRDIGTYFVPSPRQMLSHKRWIAFFNKLSGVVRIDEGAKRALLGEASLLARGVQGVIGEFKEGDIIGVEDANGLVFARGVSNFSAQEVRRILGKSTEEIKRLLPGHKAWEVIDRDNLVLSQKTN